MTQTYSSANWGGPPTPSLSLAQALSSWAGGANGAGAALPTNIPMLEGIAGNAPITDLSSMASPQTLAAINGPGFMQGMLGWRAPDGTQNAGWGGAAIGAGSALMQGILGFKQLGIAKDQLAQSKKEFSLNFGAQQKLTNSRLEDRQTARVASNPTAYQSVGDYMKKNGI